MPVSTLHHNTHGRALLLPEVPGKSPESHSETVLFTQIPDHLLTAILQGRSQ